ncbi:polysaccharide deacetylase [Bradyrhizobium oligotrophicum S58]|uniref:Chitooligosaccharide deacetylase n=1 Tax=Bradyrhizobium oligotrophicum S58 TaxID=1245469 RepID=M4ZFZ7_9BRAD|nr:allantoinase PuuE [Bradyrhizobium oligotrophicum]BAM92733.1 polysaccharide deacetylase [Bradyrhizobium oligotrophicum S58]
MSGDVYPRDMVGYGRTPPHPRWPGDARIAVQFVINYEEGGENNILHGDAASEAFLSEIVGAQPWPGQRHMNMESIYEFGSRAGFWRLWRMFTARKLPVTVFAIATAMARNPEAVAAMKEAGWEIASHGLKWIDYRDVSESDERAHIEEAIRLHTELTGERPLGFYQGRTSANTLDIVLNEQGFVYSADSYADELPYWIKGPHGPQLIVPYTLDANDMRFASPQGFNSGDQFFAYLKDSFDTLYAEGAESPRMLSVGLHCRLVGRPGRAAALARFLDYVMGHNKVWVATRLDIARHWIRTHPPAGHLRPSQMSRVLFVERYGDIFEHTPEIADRAYRAGLSAFDDSADALHTTLMNVVRAMSRDERLRLIRAHPELAGREALAGEMTNDSIGEQGRLGFTALSRAEFERVADINRRYRDKFGMPLIVALALHADRPSVIAEMDRRIGNDLDTEIANAIDQIGHITRARLAKKFEQG